MKTINFAIDLGTTNSLITKYNSGKVEVFKNPVGFKETLPSCVAFRGERILIGDKAREWLLKDPLNVFAGFKRKMGTSDNYFVPSKSEFYSPVQLSSLVLSELKNFIHTQEKPEHVVITIPASFDTVQSNATKKAGYDAGFSEVVLLQEPIAASLAFFNEQNESTSSGKWLVYDLGGGTFDVALVSATETEMRIIDHIGDNFLGGLDFDHDIVMKIILPKLIQLSCISDLPDELNKRAGKYEKLYYILLLKAEEAKKELSTTDSAEIELSFEYNGTGKEYFISISREELNSTIQPRIDGTIEMIHKILASNNLSAGDIEQIIMIGGSTYIPYVRESLEQNTGISVNCSADPTTAVAVGAAYYAGNKAAKLDLNAPSTSHTADSNISLQLSYNKATRDSEEYIAANVLNYQDGLQYRITRSDGGFDTGIKKLSVKLSDFVTLLPGKHNEFSIKVFDAKMNEVLAENIQISHGLFNLFGQPLPEDISIEVDDLDNNSTKCQAIFERNSILPITKTIYREISRTIKKGSDERLIINVLEGNSKSHPNTNLVIGVIEINGSQLQGDLIKGSDVEIRIDISESRDVTVKVNLTLFNQQFENTFSPTVKYISLQKLREEIKEIRNTLNSEIDKSVSSEDFEKAGEMQQLVDKLDTMYNDAMSLKEDELSDKKYQIEEQKRRLAQQVYGNENNPRLIRIKSIYFSWRSSIQYWCETYDDIPKQYIEEVEKLKEREITAFASNSFFQIDSLNKAQNRLLNKMILYTPSLATRFFYIYSTLEEDEYEDYKEAKRVIAAGEKALERKNYDELRAHLSSLFGLAKSTATVQKISGTGLG